MTDEKKRNDLAKYVDGALEISVEIDPDTETVWASQADIARLFGVTHQNISYHIKQLDKTPGLLPPGSFKEILNDLADKRTKTRFYNLDVIVALGYRIGSPNALKFRQWANRIIKDYLVQGYALNESRLARDPVALGGLAAEVRKLRSEEFSVYEQVRKVFKLTATDYAPNSPTVKKFFAFLQDKFLVAATGKTAAALIMERADSSKHNMGLMHVRGEFPDMVDARTGKNYCVPEELYSLHILCEQFLLFVESKALRGQAMKMTELASKFDELLALQGHTVFKGYKASLAEAAHDHAKRELAAYKKRMGYIPGAKGPKAVLGSEGAAHDLF